MKRLLSLLVGAALLVAVQAVWADDMGNMAGMSTPGISATPAVKPSVKAKKTKTKPAKELWVCPMGDYSGPKTKDGKCPKCGMKLVKQGMKKSDMGKMEGMATPGMSTASMTAPTAKTYVCSMDGFTSNKPGKCPKCGMDLVEKK